jgi:putative oxidoreductase
MMSSRLSDWSLLILRLVVGVIFILHGQMKFGLWDSAGGTMSAGMLTLFKILSVIEPLFGLAIILGIFANWAALVLAIDMLGASYIKVTQFHTAFIGHQTTGWEFDITLFASNVVLFAVGSGMLSVDRLWKKA